MKERVILLILTWIFNNRSENPTTQN